VIVRAGRPSVHALALAGVAVLLLAAAAALPLDTAPLALLACPFRAATGLPCPGCGATRAFHFAVRGRFGDALTRSFVSRRSHDDRAAKTFDDRSDLLVARRHIDRIKLLAQCGAAKDVLDHRSPKQRGQWLARKPRRTQTRRDHCDDAQP